MDKRIAAHDKTIEGQKLLISELQTKLDDKSDRIQFKRLMDLLDSRTYSMNNLLRSKRVLIDRNQRRLEDVENTFIVSSANDNISNNIINNNNNNNNNNNTDAEVLLLLLLLLRATAAAFV